jgi:RimJ/RimL family protein N-acetyltransferase
LYKSNHKENTGIEMLIPTPNGTISIRQAHEADVSAFRDLRLEALQNHPEAFSSDYTLNLAKPLIEWSERLRFQQRNYAEMIYFATVSEKLVGMTGIVKGDSPKTRHSALLWGVYVKPEWRSFHIAEGLITSCIEWARTQDVKVVKLAVVTTNTAAIRCYTRLGFKVYGVEPQANYCQETFYDELLMSLST